MLDPIEEKKFAELARLGQELHIPITMAFWKLEVTKDGKVVSCHKQRSHSWVRNAYNLMLSQMAGKDVKDSTFGAGLLSIKNIAGTILYGNGGVSIGTAPTSGTIDWEGSGYAYRGAAGVNTNGIQIGTAATVESFEDYVLSGLISEGTTAGKMNHVLMEVPVQSYNAPSKTFSVVQARYINNNSPGDIDVKEVAITTSGRLSDSQAAIFMTSRDKLGATVTVPAGGQLKVSYTFALVYPA